MIFIQYLAGIATVEAIHSYGDGYDKLGIKLKWPNDICEIFLLLLLLLLLLLCLSGY